MRRGIIGLLVGIIVVGLQAFTATDVAAEGEREALQAAFIRNNDLWLAVNEVQKPLTKEEFIRYPDWSSDGKWLTFLRDQNRPEVWTYEAATGGMRKIGEGSDKKWDPQSHRIAILSGRYLSVVSAEKPTSQERIMDNVGEFSWIPDGSGLLVSTAAELMPDGQWSAIELYILKQDASGAWVKQLFYQLPTQSNDWFAVQTSPFKWSPDGRWIAFIAKPTASLSADANTLVLLSTDGKSFLKAGQMLAYTNWFEWAPTSGKLAFIEGTGREATSNKKLTILDDIASLNKRVITPSGYADNDFTWERDEAIIVSRRKEADWSSDEEERPLPILVRAELQSGKQKNLTRSLDGYGDYAPSLLKNGLLTWVQAGQGSAEVKYVGDRARRPITWIPKLTVASDYYGRMNWNEVIDYQ